MIATPLLFTSFMLGLLGATHCVTMCGGFAGLTRASRSAGDAHDAAYEGRVAGTKLVRSRTSSEALLVAQSAGRIATYATLGIVTGALGASLGRVAARGQLVLELVSGVLLLSVGLYFVGLLPAYASIERVGAPLFRAVQPLARRLLPLRTPAQAALFGVVWGLLPCGLVYSALGLAAMSGHAITGGLVMLAFGLGTFPAIFAMGVLADSVARVASRPLVRRGAGVMMIAFGLVHVAIAM